MPTDSQPGTSNHHHGVLSTGIGSLDGGVESQLASNMKLFTKNRFSPPNPDLPCWTGLAWPRITSKINLKVSVIKFSSSLTLILPSFTSLYNLYYTSLPPERPLLCFVPNTNYTNYSNSIAIIDSIPNLSWFYQ